METKQPKWKLVAQLGDVHPLDYGGYFIYDDETGVYAPEGEKLFVEENCDTWTVYRFALDRLQIIDGILVPYKYTSEWPYPLDSYREWFDKELRAVASFIGQGLDPLREAFCSADTMQRASAYEAIGSYHGFENLDGYPLTFTDRSEVEKRYAQVQAV